MNYVILPLKGQYYLLYKVKNHGHMTHGIVMTTPIPYGEVAIGEVIEYHWSWAKKSGNDLEEMRKEYEDNWKFEPHVV